MLHGSFTALITPYKDGGATLDLEALRDLAQWQIQQGTQGLVVAGSTGEGALLDYDERAAAIQVVVEVAAGQVPVVVGCGAPSTQDVAEMIQQAQALGAQAALVVPPYYMRTTRAGIIAHFCALDQLGFPIILYNNPGRTGVDMMPEMVAQLAELCPRVIGLKESAADVSRLLMIRQLVGEGRLALFSGEDVLTPGFLASGADGAISVCSNAAPGLTRALLDSWFEEDLEGFADHRAQLFEVQEILKHEPNPIGIKWMMAVRGHCQPEFRLPLGMPSVLGGQDYIARIQGLDIY